MGGRPAACMYCELISPNGGLSSCEKHTFSCFARLSSSSSERSCAPGQLEHQLPLTTSHKENESTMSSYRCSLAPESARFHSLLYRYSQHPNDRPWPSRRGALSACCNAQQEHDERLEGSSRHLSRIGEKVWVSRGGVLYVL